MMPTLTNADISELAVPDISIPQGFDDVAHLRTETFADIYRARRSADGRPVVLKVCAPAGFERCRNEQAVLERLRGPGVCGVLGTRRQGHAMILVIEDSGGEPLAAVAGRLDLRRSLSIAIQAARALAQVHAAGYVHHNVNPRNLVWNAQTDELRLVDFSLASPVSDSGRGTIGALAGDLAYISPEQTGRTSHRVDRRSDLYSLGATLYALLVGHPPYHGEADAGTLLHAHLAREPEPPVAFRGDIPAVLSAIVMRLLRKNPDKRYQSAPGLAADLEECAASLAADGAIEPFPLGRYDRARRFEIPDRLHGREHQMDALLEAFEQAAAGERQIVLMTGEPGTGRTSTVGAAIAAFPRGVGVSAGPDGRPVRSGHTGLDGAIQGLVEHALGLPQDALDRHRKHLSAALGDGAAALVRLFPDLGTLIDPPANVPPVSTETARNRLGLSVTRLVEVFARLDGPLILFVDDLRADDRRTVDMVRHLVRSDARLPLALVLACRTDDDRSALQARLEADGVPAASTRRIHLGMLDEGDVRALVADSLGADVGTIEELDGVVDLLMSRTGGNPFHVRQMLELLHAEGHLRFRSELGRFAIDDPTAWSAKVTGEVAEVLARRLEHLPEWSQTALQVAAVAGPRFSLPLLASALERPSEDIARWLAFAEDAELIVRRRSTTFPRSGGRATCWSFLHERIRATIYETLAAPDRARWHLIVGRVLRDAARDPDVFEDVAAALVEHLERGLELIESRDERLDLASIATRVAAQAEAATAYDAGSRWYGVAAGILRDAGGWSCCYAETVEALLGQCRCFYGAARTPEAFELISAARPHVTDRDAVRLATIEVLCHTMDGDAVAAVEVGREAAARLGCELPAEPEATTARLGQRLGQIFGALAAIGDDGVLALQQADDPDVLALSELLSQLAAPAFYVDPTLSALVNATNVSLALTDGLSAATPRACVALGIAVIGGRGDYETAYRLGRLGQALSEQSGHERAATGFLFGAFCSPWFEPYERGEAHLVEAGRAGRRSGDLVHANSSEGMGIWRSVLRGETLDRVQPRSVDVAQRIARTGDGTAMSFQSPTRRLLDWLVDPDGDPSSLDADGFDEAAFLAQARAGRNTTALQTGLGVFNLHRYLTRRHGEGLELLRELRGVRPPWPGLPETLDAMFVGGLMCAAVLTSGEDVEPWVAEELEVAAGHVARAAERCPRNFRAQQLVLQAERARVGGDEERAVVLYDEAIASARQWDDLRLVAMAQELAGRAALDRADWGRAVAYLDGAVSAFAGWGAAVKVRLLREEFRGLLHRGAGQPGGAPGVAGSALDMASIIRAARAISGEIELEPLLETLLREILRTAGATGVALVLEEDDGARSVRELFARSPESRVIEAPSMQAAGLPEHVVNLVTRTCRPLVVEDVQAHAMCRDDPGLKRRGSKSLLCAPVMTKGEPVGVVVVDNTLAVGFFTPERLEALEALFSQVAVSIQNARLFARLKSQAAELERYQQHLEELVGERTAELRAAQGRLLNVSRLAGMAEVASSVLHNVGNALTSVSVSTELVGEKLSQLPLPKLDRALELLEAKAPELGSWFEQGQQGATLVRYLRGLHAELSASATGAAAEADKLQQRVEHVKVVIGHQQSYGRLTTLEEDCLPSELVEPAIAIAGTSCAAHGVALDVRVDTDRRVWVDRHQVLQILVNLLKNAKEAVIEAGREDGRVELAVFEHDDRLVLRVRDNGAGIEAADLARIFAHGFTTKKDGHGFGLHNAVNAARTMGGELRASSDGPGKGAEFALELPLVAVDDGAVSR